MPRAKKQVLKKRADGRYACRYKDQWFYSTDHDDCLRQREEFKRAEQAGIVSMYFVREYAAAWLKRTYPNANPKTLQNVKRIIQIMSECIGELPVSDVKPSDIKDIYSTRFAGMSQKYIAAAKQTICAVFDSAVADGAIRSNPARDRTAKPHKGTFKGHRSITPQEREWILTLCTDHRAHPVAMAMLYAGLRPQEAKAIDIDRDVDFKNETITVRQTAHTEGTKYVFSDKGKTDRANRTIPLLPPLKSALEGKTGLLVTNAQGQQVTQGAFKFLWTSYRRQMERAINGIDKNWYGRTREQREMKKAGTLPPWVPFTVLPYDLRHSFATMCRSAKPPIELHTVIKWMGHTDATMILKIYDEVTSDRDNAEAERLKKLTTVLTTKP